MSLRAVEILRERVQELDGGHLPIVSFTANSRLLHFTLIMASYTNTRISTDSQSKSVLAPVDADEIASTCGLLADIAQAEAELVNGPLDRTRQHWIKTNRRSTSPTAPSQPTRSQLIEVGQTNVPSAKPFGVGFYTSTAATDGHSMWRTYLDSVRGSTLHPLPWYTWQLHADGSTRIAEIASAIEWTEFVGEYPREHAGMIYPDWYRIAQEFDGVHLTLRAILAIQGFAFPAACGLIAPSYWDVESVFWLRWCFTSVQLQDVTIEE